MFFVANLSQKCNIWTSLKYAYAQVTKEKKKKEAAERESVSLETALRGHLVGQEQAINKVAAGMSVLMQISKIKSRILRSLGRFRAVKFRKSNNWIVISVRQSSH